MTRLTATERAAAHAEAAAAPPLSPEVRAKLAAILNCPGPDMTNGQARPGPAAAAADISFAPNKRTSRHEDNTAA
jgi:hypothetical protein